MPSGGSAEREDQKSGTRVMAPFGQAPLQRKHFTQSEASPTSILPSVVRRRAPGTKQRSMQAPQPSQRSALMRIRTPRIAPSTAKGAGIRSPLPVRTILSEIRSEPESTLETQADETLNQKGRTASPPPCSSRKRCSYRFKAITSGTYPLPGPRWIPWCRDRAQRRSG